MKSLLLAIIAIANDGELFTLELCADLGRESPLQFAFWSLDVYSPIWSHGYCNLWRDFDSLFSDT